MKKGIFIIILFISTYCLFAQPLDGILVDINPETNISFLGGKITFTIFGEKPLHYTTNYVLTYENKVPFIVFDYTAGFPLELEVKPGKQKWLVLFAEGHGFLFAYDGKSDRPLRDGFWGVYAEKSFLTPVEVSADSFLIEKGKKYPAENLDNQLLDNPWVEGKGDDGIGSKIRIQVGNDTTFGRIFISNGFVSYTKPILFENNNRVRKLKIYNKAGTIKMSFELKDTPNIQEIKLPKATSELILEIESVYKGSKYNDTCINFILVDTSGSF